MKKILLILFILFGYNSFSQTIELIVSGGFNSSTQTLRSDGATQIGVSFNTIGGKQYQVDAYPGYHIKGLIGISNGFANVLGSSTWAEIYGVKHIGSIKALTTALMVFATAFGTALFGFLIDLGFSIEQISLVSGSYISVSIILLFIIKNKLNPKFK